MADAAPLDSATDPPRRIELTDPPIRLADEALRSGRRAFESWLPRSGQTASPHAIHQLRVALRRLRVALKLFEDVVPAEAGQLRRELGGLARELGDVRDLDVHADILRAARENLPEHAAALARLEARNDAARATARGRLARTFEDARTAHLRAALETLTDRNLEPHAPASADVTTIGEACANRIARSVKRLRKLGRKLDEDSSPADLHRVRIRSKRLRYEIECFQEVVPGLGALLRAAKRLQNVLGAHNDAMVAARRLREQANERRGSIVEADALDAAIRLQKRAAARERERFESTWRRFEEAAARTRLPR